MTLVTLWIAGFPVLGVIAGLVGTRFRRVRQVVVWLGAVLAVAVFTYGLFRGGPNECFRHAASGTYTCHPTAYIADLNILGVAVVVAVTLLSFAPIAATLTGSRVPSVVAMIVFAFMLLIFTLGLLPWVPAAACVLAAAIAGPPGKGEGLSTGEPLDNVSAKPRPGQG